MSKSMVRSVKNVTKGFSSVEVKVRNATSNDAWGPSGTDMSEIAQMTFNSTSDFGKIMDMLDKRLNDKGKNWRHVLKSLKVLDYCLHEGSEHVVTWARKNIYIIKTLREFQYVDDDGRDVGLNVRMSAKELTSLILDEERLRAERHDRKLWKARVTGLDDFASGEGGNYGMGSNPARPRKNERNKNRSGEEDLEMKLALEASKNEAEEDGRRRAKGTAKPEDDDDLARAIQLSKEEEDLRRRELEEANAQSLFDDTPVQQSQPTGYNQGYQQQGAVDWFGNPVEANQQQVQPTGYSTNPYAQQQFTGMQQAQPTGYQNGFGYSNGYPQQQQQQQPQQYGYDQFQQQQPTGFMQPQQTSFNMNNPYSQTQSSNGFGQQQQQQPLEQQSTLQPGSQNPWASSSSLDNIKPQATGSNNPFAAQPSYRPSTASAQRAPTLSTLQEQKASQNFPTFTSTSSFPAQQQQPLQQQRTQSPQNEHHAALNALLASGDGQDTFGNTGNLRIPAQHTAPGTFVNSAGSGLNRLQPNQTGTNPFLGTQFTGMPQAQYGAQQQQQGFGGSMMAPAQTGPAHMGNNNPFGMQGGQQGQQQRQGGSLIDL